MVSKASTKRVNKILQQATENLKNKPTKNRITITIDTELDKLLKGEYKDKINVSDICNQCLWFWTNKLKKQEEVK